MSIYEYRVVPAPRQTPKVKGKRDPHERFAYTLSETMNEMAAEGWEYLRAETLPAETRSGLFGSKTIEHHVLVFRREREGILEQPAHQARPPSPQASVRELRAARGIGPAVRPEPPDSPKPA